MATSPVPQWAQEMSPRHRGPTIAGTLTLFAILTVVLISWLGGYDRLSEGANRGKPPTLCQEHAGRPGWDYVCRPKPEVRMEPLRITR
jgi:hypothetical protein